MTTAEVPGRRILRAVGDVLGVVTRSRVQPQAQPGQQQGIAIAQHETALTHSRQEAIHRMITMAIDAGANAVVGVRFDSSEISQGLSEVSVYGTGVLLAEEQGAPDPAANAAAERPGNSHRPTASSIDTDQPTDPEQAQSPSQPSEQETTWHPRDGTGTLLRDRETSDHHAASSPVLPGHPDSNT